MFIPNSPSEEEKNSYGGHKLSENLPVCLLEPFREGYSEPDDSASPDQDLALSYRSNWIRFTLDEAHYALIPAWDEIVIRADVTEMQLDEAPGKAVWHAITGFVLTNSHPFGEPQFGEQEVLLRKQLVQSIHQEGIKNPLAALVTHKRMRWTEYAQIAPLPSERAIALAREWGQPALLEIQGDGYVKVHSLSAEIGRTSYRARLFRLNVRPCPMREGFEQQYLCRMQGGPWVSRSIHRAANWKAHRSRNLELLGCGPCEDGTKPVADPTGQPWLQGGPISLAPISVPSRHGRPSYGKYE